MRFPLFFCPRSFDGWRIESVYLKKNSNTIKVPIIYIPPGYNHKSRCQNLWISSYTFQLSTILLNLHDSIIFYTHIHTYIYTYNSNNGLQNCRATPISTKGCCHSYLTWRCRERLLSQKHTNNSRTNSSGASLTHTPRFTNTRKTLHGRPRRRW